MVVYLLTGIFLVLDSIFQFIPFTLNPSDTITLSAFDKIFVPITSIIMLVLGFLFILIGIKKFRKGNKTGLYLKITFALIIIEILATLFPFIWLFFSNGWNVCIGNLCPGVVLGWVSLIARLGYLILLILMLINLNSKNGYWVAGTALIVLLAGLFVYMAIFLPQDPNDCTKFKDINELDACYLNFAVKNKDVNLCNKTTMSDNDYFNNCLDNVIEHDLNRQLDHLKICRLHRKANYFTEDTCFLILAGKRQEPSICQEIRNESTRDLCISQSSI